MISLRRVWAIAINTVREAIRNKLLYPLLFFAIVLIATGVLISTLSYVERERILQDVGHRGGRPDPHRRALERDPTQLGNPLKIYQRLLE